LGYPPSRGYDNGSRALTPTHITYSGGQSLQPLLDRLPIPRDPLVRENIWLPEEVDPRLRGPDSKLIVKLLSPISPRGDYQKGNGKVSSKSSDEVGAGRLRDGKRRKGLPLDQTAHEVAIAW
jgi:hypothetical protein